MAFEQQERSTPVGFGVDWPELPARTDTVKPEAAKADRQALDRWYDALKISVDRVLQEVADELAKKK